MIVEWCHQRTAHGRRGMAINEVRSNGFWWSNATQCLETWYGCILNVACLEENLESHMADLPTDRTLDGPPYTNLGVDMFDPFLIKEGSKVRRKEGAEKIWDTFHLFSWTTSRAIHIGCTCSIDFGIWERQIYSACNILVSLLVPDGGSLRDESLRTLLKLSDIEFQTIDCWNLGWC